MLTMPIGGRIMDKRGPGWVVLFGISVIAIGLGTFAYGVEFEKLVDLDALGGLVVKGLSREPIEGNAPPRVYEREAGMINSIGLQNIGVHAFVKEKLPALARLRTAVFANVFGNCVDDYLEVLRVLNDHEGLAGYELNVSCPNTAQGGIYFSSDPALLCEVVAAAKRVAARPLIVKLSPNVSEIEPLARAAEASGADALSLVNTFTAMVVDIEKGRPMLANGTGGLSGPAIKPIAVFMTHRVYTEVAKAHNSTTARPKHHLLSVDRSFAAAIAGKEGAVDCQRRCIHTVRHQRDHPWPPVAGGMPQVAMKAQRVGHW